MRIVLKPMGVLVIVGTLATLSTLLIVQSQKAKGPDTVAAAPVPPASAPSAPVATGSPEGIVYKDALVNGWEKFDWVKDVVWNDTKNARGGSGAAIRVQPKGYEAVFFHHEPMSAESYDRISLFAHGGEKGRQVLRICLLNQANEKAPPGVTAKPLTAGQWVPITIPLKEFKPDGKSKMTGVWVMNDSDKAAETFYLDDVRLLKPGEPEPTE